MGKKQSSPLIARLTTLLKQHREVLLYLVFGVLTTAVNYIVYFLFRWLLPDTGWSMAASNTAAWVLAVLFAYGTNRAFVFRSRTNTPSGKRREFAAFVAARVFSLLLDQAALHLGVLVLGWSEPVTKLASNVLVVIVNYFLSKFLIFRNKAV